MLHENILHDSNVRLHGVKLPDAFLMPLAGRYITVLYVPQTGQNMVFILQFPALHPTAGIWPANLHLSMPYEHSSSSL